ncbi:MAG: HAMP domain-containing sensor histidine kinase [Polyangia bacterium]
MRLTTKFIVTLVLGMMVVLGLNAWLRLEREVRLFESGMRRHAHLFGHALGNGVAWAWKTSGETSAIALVAEANEASSDLDVRWVWLDGKGPEELRPRLPVADLEPVRQGHELSRRIPATSGPGDLFTYVPIALPGNRHGALQIAESLESQHEVIREIWTNVLWSVGGLAVVISGLAALLGVIFVGRPTRKLVEQARRIGAGDLSQPVLLRQRDELGQIAAGMNAMSDRLAHARDQIAVETAIRVAATEQLRHADRLMTVGKLASGIAHELGTPLNVVAGRGQLIAARDSVGEEAVEGARIIVDQANRMTQIIRQLLDFARPGRARRARVQLEALAAQTERLLRPLAQKRGVVITLVQSAATSADLDEGQIQQALTNLIVNAIQATATGGRVVITLSEVTAFPPRDVGSDAILCARIDVTDSGHGMSPDTLSHIFEPFFTTKDVGEGTGLGLSVTYGIVREHGGWIDVTSEPGRGSTFSLLLPVTSSEPS